MRVKTEGRFIGTEVKTFNGVDKVYILVQQEGDTTQEKFGLSKDFMDFDLVPKLSWGDILLIDADFNNGYNRDTKQKFAYKSIRSLKKIDFSELF